jgi:hypothetical protein
MNKMPRYRIVEAMVEVAVEVCAYNNENCRADALWRIATLYQDCGYQVTVDTVRRHLLYYNLLDRLPHSGRGRKSA